MRKHSFRLPAAFLSAILLFTSLFVILPASAETGATEIVISDGTITNVVWNYGYVGSSHNAYGNANRISNGTIGGSYRYTDILTVPKAGTTISWSDTNDKRVSSNAYIISSWKQEGAEWILDPDGTNIEGISTKNTGIVTYDSTTKVTTYSYTTYKDNEHLRLGCYGTAGSDVCPTVYIGTSTVSANGTLDDIMWFSGYVGSNLHGTAAYRDNIVREGGNYAYSAPILLEKAGTKIEFDVTVGGSITKFASQNAYVFSIWERENDNSFALGYGMPGGEAVNTAWQTISGSTCHYFYTSSYDNEYIRLCYFSGAASSALPDTFPTVSVTENSGGDAILSLAYYDPANYEFIRSVKWNNGYVGSSTNTSNTNKIYVGNEKEVYKYSDIIPVYGKGSLVMFTDCKSSFASAAAYSISSWSSSDSALTEVDMSGVNFHGADASSYTVNPDGSRTYYYYTTKDVEYLRVCIRSDGANRGTVNTDTNNAFIPPSVYVTSAAELVTWTPGYYIMGNPDATWGDGLYSENTHASFTYSSYFTLPQAGTTVSIPLLASSSVNIAVFSTYDKAGETYTGVSVITPPNGTYVTVGDTRLYSYTTTRDNETLRICANANYTNTAGNAFLPVLATTLGTYGSLFDGKEMVIVGDSYFAGNGINQYKVWPRQFAELYGMTFYNHGINGSTVSNYVTTNNPMVNRLASMSGGESTALVLFEGGRNDYNQGVPIGDPGDTDSKTFYGALYTMITGLLQKYPNALIICLNAWDLTGVTANNPNKAGHTSNDYAAAFRDYVTALDNDRLVMLNSNSTDVVPIYLKEAAFRAAYGQTPTDISHMNPKGMKYALPYFETLLGGFMGDYMAATASGSIRFEENGATFRLVSSAEAGSATLLPPMLQKADFIGWGGTVSGKDVFLPVGGTLQISAGDTGTLTPYYLDISCAGNSIRLTPGSTGIRFLTDVNEAQYNAIAALPGVNLTKGTLIVPQFYLKDLGGELTFESIAANSKKFLNVVANGWYASDGATATLAGSIANIFKSHYTMAFVGQGYVTVTYTDGSDVTFYAKNATAAHVAVYGLAAAALDDRNDTQTPLYAYETENGDYSPYTATQRTVLTGFVSEVLEVREDITTETGFVASQKGVTAVYTITYDSVAECLKIVREDGTPITDTTFAGVSFCGLLSEYTVKDGALLIAYSEYSDLY